MLYFFQARKLVNKLFGRHFNVGLRYEVKQAIEGLDHGHFCTGTNTIGKNIYITLGDNETHFYCLEIGGWITMIDSEVVEWKKR